MRKSSPQLGGAEVFESITPHAAPPSKFLLKKEGEDEKVPAILNKEYSTWIAKDQQVLSYLLVSLSKEILLQVSNATTASEVWAGIESFFASQSRVKIISTGMALGNASKGSSTVAEYYSKMKTLANEMASAGRRQEDDEFVPYILNGLDEDFDAVVTAVAARVEPITPGELYTKMISHEQRLELRSGGSQSSVNLASCCGHGGGNQKGLRPGSGSGGNNHQNQKGGWNNNNANKDQAPF